MYCSKCGRAARYDDVFCSHCGCRLQKDKPSSAEKEEIVFNPLFEDIDQGKGENAGEQRSYGLGDAHTQDESHQQSGQQFDQAQQTPKFKIDSSEFVWDVHEFSNTEKKKREDVVVDWQKLKVYEINELNGELDDDGAERPMPKAQGTAPTAVVTSATLGTGLAPNVPATASSPKPQGEARKTATSITIEDIEREIGEENGDASRDADRINKFYTFNQKNEEFQKLLDREYERVNQGRIGEESELKREDWNSLGVFDPQRHLYEAEERRRKIESGELVEQDTEAHSTTTVGEGQPEPFSPKESPENFGQPKNTETVAKPSGGAFEKPDILDNDTIVKRFDTLELEKDLLELSIEKERKLRGKPAPKNAEQQLSPDEITMQETIKLIDELYGKAPQSEYEESEPYVAIDEKDIEQASTAEVLEAELASDNPTAPEQQELQEQYEIKDEPRFDLSFFDDKEDEDDEEDIEKEEISGRSRLLRVIIVIAALLLLAEVAILGIRQFAPESAAAATIDQGLTKVAQFFIGLTGGAGDTTDGTDANGAGTDGSIDADGQDEDYGLPFTAEELVFNAYTVNKNIKSITADKTLAYDASKQYAVSEISKTAPLSSNLWYKDENGNDVYLDQEVVNTLVAFDSQWIDYVNDKKENVFSLLSEDGEAYKNCKAFSKAGKVTKSFLSLKIGELRASEKGYYLWAQEEIQTTENGKTTTDTLSWIYYMEPIDNEIKIVDYYRF